MTTYRVGAAGATVFDSEGRALCRLRAGTVVVEGTIPSSDPPTAEPLAVLGPDPPAPTYADKMIRPQRGPRS